ncbi:hypothetical protein HC891_15150 [Candidatus Gracilibacteria bacterium]|nr:hypothetical protein [Candidatus Gracilibacteria bacterium]
MSQLRHILPVPDLLVTDNTTIGRNPARVQADTTLFAQQMALALRSEHAEEISDALRLYRGPFLDGFSLRDTIEFDLWVEQERQNWGQSYSDGHQASRYLYDGLHTLQRAHERVMMLYGLLACCSIALRQQQPTLAAKL